MPRTWSRWRPTLGIFLGLGWPTPAEVGCTSTSTQRQPRSAPVMGSLELASTCKRRADMSWHRRADTLPEGGTRGTKRDLSGPGKSTAKTVTFVTRLFRRASACESLRHISQRSLALTVRLHWGKSQSSWRGMAGCLAQARTIGLAQARQRPCDHAPPRRRLE